MLQVSNNKWSLFAVALLTLSLSGCGDAVPDNLGALNGTLKSGGEACGNCLVRFFNSETSRSYGCKVEELGTFEKELPFGEYQVAVVQEPTNDSKEVFDKRIPKKYRNKTTSGLIVSITSGEPAVLNIEM